VINQTFFVVIGGKSHKLLNPELSLNGKSYNPKNSCSSSSCISHSPSLCSVVHYLLVVSYPALRTTMSSPQPSHASYEHELVLFLAVTHLPWRRVVVLGNSKKKTQLNEQTPH